MNTNQGTCLNRECVGFDLTDVNYPIAKNRKAAY